MAPRTYELSVFLADVLGVTDVGAYFPHRVTYHPSCHSLRMLRVGDAPLRLLRAVTSLDLADLPEAETCCGFGGTFSVKNPDVSAAICLLAQLRHNNLLVVMAPKLLDARAIVPYRCGFVSLLHRGDRPISTV